MIEADYRVERTTSNEDLDLVATLEAECFTNPWTRSMLEREITGSDTARLYVLRAPHRPVAAFCTCWLIVDELHINTIAVEPSMRRTGMGTALMEYVMRDASRAGALRATLEVRASNEAARRLYARLGFIEAAVRPRYYTHPEEDAVILWHQNLPRG